MQPSSTLCRAQEARQNAVAADATLANVRNVALVAASMWAKEALAADKREARKTGPHDRGFSENPDRGFADLDAMSG